MIWYRVHMRDMISADWRNRSRTSSVPKSTTHSFKRVLVIPGTRYSLQGLCSARGCRPLRPRNQEHNYVKGAEGKGPWFGATSSSDLIMPRAGLLLAAPRCAVCLLAMSLSDGQSTGVICQRTRKRTERGQPNEENKETSTHVHTGSWYVVLHVRKNA